MIIALFVIFFTLILIGVPIAGSIGLAVFGVIIFSGQVSPVIVAQAMIRQMG